MRKLKRTATVAAVLTATVALASGCNGVRRRLTITSEPSGAVVYLNNKEIGKTPISTNFLYSGTYNIRCYKEGYETTETAHVTGTPWYLWPGFDFFSENFVPGEIRDEQSCHVELPLKREVPENELLEAATRLREEAHSNSSLNYYVGATNGADSNASVTGVERPR
ncbi:MAG: PEGA domain-containing protein [Thermoguttaceae bacterium]|nr:PEGA domain-containing protein [Thermoguttaceae bacterium]